MAECRFCAKKLNKSENHSTINDEIREYFMRITQIELLESDLCSTIVCELCLRSMQLANSLRAHLLENEQKMYDLLETEELDEPIQYFDPIIEANRQNSSIDIEKIETNSENKVDQAKNNNSLSHKNAVLSELLSKPLKKSNEPKIESPTHKQTPIGRDKTKSDELPIHIKAELEADMDSVIKEELLHETDVNNSLLESYSSNYDFDFSHETNQSKQPPKTNPTRCSERVIHKSTDNKTFECPHCDFVSKFQNMMKTHLITSHQAEIQSYKCPSCDSTYFKGSNLKRHILVKHMNHRYDCLATGCSLKFQDRSSLRRHIVGFHGKFLPPDELDDLVQKTKKEANHWFSEYKVRAESQKRTT